MPPTTLLTPYETLARLLSPKCPGCKLPKRAQHAFCIVCFQQLPYYLKRLLHDTDPDGFSAGYGRAIEFLQVDGADE